jgi:hypothetical protein
MYGNADPLDIKQWFQMSSSVPNPYRTFNPATGVCSNMFTGLSIEFLVAKTGPTINPQNKIVSALATVTTSDVVFRYVPPISSRAFLCPFSLTRVTFVCIRV